MTESQNETNIEFRPEENLIRADFHGVFSLDEWLAQIDRIAHHPDYRPGMDAVHDLRDAKLDFPASRLGEMLSELRKRTSEWGGGWRFAVVVTDPLTYGLSGMSTFWLDKESFRISVFRDPDQAERWARSRDEDGR